MDNGRCAHPQGSRPKENKGVEHCPVAEEETHLLLIEPAGTPNTGDIATAAVKNRI